jgi:glutamate racemase
MNIGIFDSGLGGLLITHSIIQALPQYHYLYLGDTARVPYGNRSQAAIYEFTRQAVEYLFQHDCQLIIVACNTASAEALRRVQREYLPAHYPNRRVLGVLIPAVEAAVATTKTHRIGVLATRGTISSGAFERELHKLDKKVQVISQPAPLLVPLVENDGLQWAGPILDSYLLPFKDIDTLILGCTHYPFLKVQIRAKMGPSIAVISQDEVIPAKLSDYLRRHPETEHQLARDAVYQFKVTDLTDDAARLGRELFKQAITLELIPQLGS